MAPAPAAKGPGGLDTDALRRSWPDVLAKLFEMRRSTWTFVSQNAQVADYDGRRVLLAISTVGLAETFRRGPHADWVRQALIDVLGVDARVEGVPSSDGAAGNPGSPLPATPARQLPAGVPTPPDPHDVDDAPHDAAPVQGRTPREPEPAPAQASSRPPAPSRTEGWATPPRTPAPSWSEAPPAPESAPTWASPLERAKAEAVENPEVAPAERVVDDTAVSDDDESLDDLSDVGVPVVERLLGGTVIREEER